MALALRLRRALAAASTAAPLLRPAAASSSRPLPLAPVVAPPPPRPWLLPGAATAGFRSTAAAAARGGDYGAEDNKISPDEILFEGCDYNHWLITMEFPDDPKPTRDEMIEHFLQTLAKVVGSYEEAKKRMYAFSTTTYIGFQAEITEEMSEKFRGMPGVVFILPDSYLYPETKEYGGDKYENGKITPRPPPVHYSKQSRTDRNRNYRGNYQDSPPRQGNYQNSPPPQGGYQNSPPQQGNFQTYRPQQDGRGYTPQQNYAQAPQDGRGGYGRNDYADRSGYNGPPSGFQGQAPPYQSQGQGYNPQERRQFSQGQDFRPGGPPAPGTYGQPSTPGNYGQPPPSTYPGSNQGVPGVTHSYGGDNRHGARPAYGGDNWQGGSSQYPSPGEGQGSWQGRQ